MARFRAAALVKQNVRGVVAGGYNPPMLREVKDAGVQPAEIGPLGRRWRFVDGQRSPAVRWSGRRIRRLDAEQATRPVALLSRGARVYWWFEDRFYWEDEGLDADDVLALIRDRERRERARLQRAHAALAHTAEPAPRRRQAIPREVRLAVFERDEGRCRQCGATFELQFDHVIPVALGGSDSAENLQVLCGRCNRSKGAGL